MSLVRFYSEIKLASKFEASQLLRNSACYSLTSQAPASSPAWLSWLGLTATLRAWKWNRPMRAPLTVPSALPTDAVRLVASILLGQIAHIITELGVTAAAVYTMRD
ncbi:hypothetical protein ONZ51_g631 [Trametes cubensis]|uniref:Uncharacterized protein n=1 Tax=Trametes cubensis TaxID=1111947 RepID=A0AAD7U4G9_9APHY|nr:hypothetical protein ONZ51_g631 [Trametes cubensis]